MGKAKSRPFPAIAPKDSLFVAVPSAVDPALASLFAQSSGPVTFTQRERIPTKTSDASPVDGVHLPKSNGVLGQLNVLSSDEHSALENSTDVSSDSGDEAPEAEKRPRKRRRILPEDDIEAQYLNRLVREEAQDQIQERQVKKLASKSESVDGEDEADISEAEQQSDAARTLSDGESIPLHETVATGTESSNGVRTVFLGNVSTEAIKSKSSRRILEKYLTNVLESLPKHQPPHRVETLRFRSTAFVGGAGPKKAAFAKKELMDQTTRSTNAYVVYSTDFAARHSAAKLNGTIVLDRHIRADYLAKPSNIDHRRCIFVGNLGFVDEETPNIPADDGEPTTRRAKAKVPADAEEGLWRTFGKVGKVESVRVVRDKETRIGKGFAYVQFVDENGVEAALLMNEKKFPPMLPRKLRVMRAKKMQHNRPSNKGDAGMATHKSGANRTFGSTGKDAKHSRSRSANGPGIPRSGFRKAESFVFEGSRATSSLKRKKQPAVKPTSRSSRRGAAFKAAGGKGSSKTKAS